MGESAASLRGEDRGGGIADADNWGEVMSGEEVRGSLGPSTTIRRGNGSNTAPHLKLIAALLSGVGGTATACATLALLGHRC